MRGVAGLDLATMGDVGAPASGLVLGSDSDGPVTLRVFRPVGTRIAVVGGAAVAHLLTLRAAGAGAAIRVVSARGPAWAPLVGHAADARVIGPRAPLDLPAGPTLVVDDTPGTSRAGAEVGAWHCRVDVRTPRHASEMSALAHADLMLFGRVSPELAADAMAVLRVPGARGEALSSLAAGTVALLRRGSVRYVTLGPSAAEIALLQASR